jgi:hypothetical protein
MKKDPLPTVNIKMACKLNLLTIDQMGDPDLSGRKV